MTSKECEKKLLDLMNEAYRIFRENTPGGNHLSMFATDDGCCVMGYKPVDGVKNLVVNCFGR